MPFQNRIGEIINLLTTGMTLVALAGWVVPLSKSLTKCEVVAALPPLPIRKTRLPSRRALQNRDDLFNRFARNARQGRCESLKIIVNHSISILARTLPVPPSNA